MEEDLSEKIMSELLIVFIKLGEIIQGTYFSFKSLDKIEIELDKYIKVPNINEKKIDFDSDILYQYFLIKLQKFLTKRKIISFNSIFSVVYFKRIINYLKLIKESNISIAKDKNVKIFIYLLFYFFDESLMEKGTAFKKKRLNLDETFFKGTFIELKEKYSLQVPYKDPEELAKYINICKFEIINDIRKLIEYTFQKIQSHIETYGKKNDEVMKKIYEESCSILAAFDKETSEKFSKDFIQKITNFYLVKENSIFINYICETEESERKMNIDKEFLNSIESQYSTINFDYSLLNNINGKLAHKTKLDQYLIYMKKKYLRMHLSSLPEILKLDLNDDATIFSFLDHTISQGDCYEFENARIFRNQLDNLNQEKIKKIIEEILNENEFFKYYFSALKSDITKKFFNSYLSVDEKNNEFLLHDKLIKGSECFADIYQDFIKKYDKENENFKDFKNLLILKILSYGDRAYNLPYLKKIVINPAQFNFKEKIDDNELKYILKAYILVILLHETEHFLRPVEKNDKVFNDTPRDREGGRMFIKYLFGVLSINHIDINQSKKILDSKFWNDHTSLKTIFNDQLEDTEEENMNEFIMNYFPNSISFCSTKYNKRKMILLGLKK